MSINEMQEKAIKQVIKTYNRGAKSFSVDVLDKHYKDDFDRFELVNISLEDLKKRGYIELQYAGKNSKQIKKIFIIESAVPELSEKYNVVNIDKYKEKALSILQPFEDSEHNILKDFVRKQINSITSQKSRSKTSDEELTELKDILIGIEGILSQTDDITVREKSITLYNDSKRLEKLISKICKIIMPECSNIDEVLAFYHIYNHPTYVMIKGNYTLYFNDGSYLKSTSEQGAIQLSYIGWVDRLQFVETSKALTIENLTSFEQYLPTKEDGIVIYLGGFSNNVNVELLKRTSCDVYHFGDMDANGYKILYNLQDRINRKVISYKMGPKDAVQSLSYGKPMTEWNKKELTNMLMNDRYSEDDKKVFKILLENEVTIEQEIIH